MAEAVCCFYWKNFLVCDDTLKACFSNIRSGGPRVFASPGLRIDAVLSFPGCLRRGSSKRFIGGPCFLGVKEVLVSQIDPSPPDASASGGSGRFLANLMRLNSSDRIGLGAKEVFR